LEEEVAEYLESTESEELADILEVVYALAKLSGITKTQLERLRLKKLAEKGGFKDKIFLIEKNG
jgi:predicted house-cleaning noncanonical NTP pyrophosphatase (MazG superfamily)